MNDPQTACDPDRIDKCLSSSLGEEECVELEAHLEHCVHCRRILEARAGQPDDWNAARDFLSSAVDEATSDSDDLEVSCSDAFIKGVLGVLSPSDDPRMLGRLGTYEVAGVVGHGGMGVVLKALDPALNRYVAVKVLAPHLAVSGAARQRFAREARSAASVVHENVVAIHAVADAHPLPYFVMPYLRGASLQKRLDAYGPLSVTEILRVGMQISAGLAAAHAQGLVHRDIKPANVLLEDGVERLRITDFGLARAVDDASLTRTGVIAGTPQFMSPEQSRGDVVDARSDLFSLGSVMYAMCTGRPPFRAETSLGILHRILHDVPRSIQEINPEIPGWLSGFIGGLHAKDPNERFQSAEEVAALLERCLAHQQQPNAVALPVCITERLKQEQDCHRQSILAFLLQANRVTIPTGAVASLALLFASWLIVSLFWNANVTKELNSTRQVTDLPNAERSEIVSFRNSATEKSSDEGVAIENYLSDLQRDLDALKAEVQPGATAIFGDEVEPKFRGLDTQLEKLNTDIDRFEDEALSP
jgi:serine/threonine protein kinase